MPKRTITKLSDAWSATEFTGDDLSFYAQKFTLAEARQGIVILSVILLSLFGVETVLLSRIGLGHSYIYTGSLLALLAVHVLVSAHVVRDTRSIYLLGMTLLLVNGTAFVLLAHQSGSLNFALFASVTLLFVVIPIVPWGLREAALVMALIYGTFTISTLAGGKNFDPQTLWSLQFIMISAGLISLALVVRNTLVRKTDIRTRYDLEQAHKKMMHLSHQDPLTGAWNRRYMQAAFRARVAEWHTEGKRCHLALLDIDNFKPINDSCGHDYGDEVLRCVSSAFNRLTNDQSFLVRMGGDEFAYLFTADDPQAVIKAGIEDLRVCMAKHRKRHAPEISMSVGMVALPVGVTVTQEDAYREADSALYEAKARKEALRSRANIVSRVLDGGVAARCAPLE